MKLKSTGIDHVNMTVKNLKESCDFWYDLFGFEIIEEFPSEKGKIIGDRYTILALYESRNMEDLKIKPPKSGFNHVSINVENFESIEQKCKELDIEIKFGGSVQWEKSRSFWIYDPNGYEIELSEVWTGGLLNKI